MAGDQPSKRHVLVWASKPRPVIGGGVVARPTMTLTCVFDHRVVDGAQVAQFMCELQGSIGRRDHAVGSVARAKAGGFG